MKCWSADRSPASKTRRNSSGFNNRFRRENFPAYDANDGLYSARRARPFERRALITLRPLRVAIRARKPWLRTRLRLLG